VRIEFYQPAGEHERYMPHAFDGIIGQEAPFKIEGAERGRATVVAVKVDKDGRGATWTVDIAGGDPGKAAEAQAGRWRFRMPDDPA
jgi:hypothetical protein